MKAARMHVTRVVTRVVVTLAAGLILGFAGGYDGASGLFAIVPDAAAQTVDDTAASTAASAGPDRDLLRVAAEQASSGDYAGAEESLRTVLAENPAHTNALLTLERLLRAQGRGADVLPLIERYLDAYPDGWTVRALQLELLARGGDRDAFASAAEEWIERDPRVVEAYREIVGTYQEILGADRALDLIEEARDRTGRPDVLAMEAADVLASEGDAEEAVEEWSLAVMDDTNSMAVIVRRIGRLPGYATAHMERFTARVLELEVPAERTRGVARLVLDAGYGESAVRLASAALPELQPRIRKGFLAQFGTRAEDLGLTEPALWAYERLREETETVTEARSLDRQVAELALATGDTARAVGAWERLASSLPLGDPQRREALATSLELDLATLDPSEAVRRYGRFRSEYRDAPELDGLAAGVAAHLVDAGEADLALSVLRGVDGPLSRLERAYLSLENEDVEAGAAELSAALASLPPREATEALALLGLLRGAQPAGATLGGRVAAAAHRGRPAEALEILDGELMNVSLDDRPGLLSLGARIADEAEMLEQAAELRGRLVENFPESLERPEASVRLARFQAARGGGTGEAIRILEELILSRPSSAVVPEARRELEQLRARDAGNERR